VREARTPQQLTTEPAEDYSPSWFPDGKRIAFLVAAEPRKTLWSFAIEDGRQERIRSLENGDASWRLSPDGKRVAFHARDGRTLNIWTTAVEGGAPRQITFDRELMGFPSWSPDGRFIAGEIKRGNDTHVAVVPAEGGEIEQLTFEAGQSWPYGWSPEGDKISFAGMREGRWNVYWVSRRERTQKQLTQNRRLNTYVRYPAWSPLGDQIVYEYAEIAGNIWLLEWP
jgi:Tol biopolymer transport system component